METLTAKEFIQGKDYPSTEDDPLIDMATRDHEEPRPRYFGYEFPQEEAWPRRPLY